MRMKRKSPEPKEEGCALWVVTFGDAMSLLVTFFVMLVSFASFEESALMDLMGAMKGGLRATPVLLASSITDAPPPNRLEIAEALSTIPVVEPDDALIDGNSMEDSVSRLYPVDTSDFFLQLLDNGVSLVIRSGAVFDAGTAHIRRPESEVWRVAAGLMEMTRSEIRIVSKLPENVVVYLDSFSTAWGLGIERSLQIHRFLNSRFGIPHRQMSTAVQVDPSMVSGEAIEGSIEIRYVGMDLLQFRDIPKSILSSTWRDTPPGNEE